MSNINPATAYAFTRFASDDFQRPNENPLNPANWLLPVGLVIPFQVLNKNCICASMGEAGASWKGTPSIPSPNQYVRATIGAWGGPNSVLGLLLQADAAGDSFIDALMSNDGVHYYVQAFDTAVQIGSTFLLPGKPQPGDTLLFGVFGSNIFVTYNGVTIISGTSNNLGSGSLVDFIMVPNSAVADTSITLIEMGPVALPGGGDHIPPVVPLNRPPSAQQKALPRAKPRPRGVYFPSRPPWI